MLTEQASNFFYALMAHIIVFSLFAVIIAFELKKIKKMLREGEKHEISDIREKELYGKGFNEYY